MHHDVCAQRHRLLEVGRGEGVVNDHQSPGGVREVGDGRDVSDRQQRVGRSLDPDGGGLTWPDSRLDACRIGEVRDDGDYPPALVDPREEAKGAPVGVGGDDEMAAG